MSKASTRVQFMYVEVKKGSNIVELYGPTEVVGDIYKAGYSNDFVKCTFSYLGTSMRLVLCGTLCRS